MPELLPLLAGLLTIIRYTAPVALAAIGETVNQKSGVINIGLEGMMLVAAFFAMLVGLSTGNPWLGLLAGTGSGLLLAAISSWFTLSLSADQVVVGTALNLFALGITGTLYRAKFGQSGALLDVKTIPQWNGIDPVMVFLILAALAAWFLLFRTGWGLALRAAGEYPKAAEASGYSVKKLRLGAGLFGGAFAGLAGAYLSVGISGSFAENMTAGRGFIAIAMVTFGRWKPQLVLLAALLIGFVESLQYRFQSLGWNVPFQLLLALPYIVALLVLVLVGKGTLAPAALAQAYQREK
ncbi:MAG: ABC transporter permease [Fimbriimonas sp.]